MNLTSANAKALRIVDEAGQPIGEAGQQVSETGTHLDGYILMSDLSISRI